MTTATPSTPTTKPKAEKGAGEYVVLRQTQDAAPGIATETWERIVGEFRGTAEQAIKKAAKDKEGHYVAVPARSFKPVSLTTETTTRVKLS
jgi:hypothetical protein